MSTLRTRNSVLLAAGLSCLLAGFVVAQQETVGPAGQDRLTERNANATSGASEDVNRFIASCLLGKNKAEVEISKFAQQQAENPEVKKFAQMLVKDHSSMISKLQPLAGGEDASRPRQPGAATGTPSDRTGIASSTARPGQGDQAVNQLIAIDKQIIERCTELLRQELESKSGAEFDKCYIGSQVGSHMQASAALEVISQQATGELQELASQAKEKVDHHLQQAKQLAQQFEGSAVRDPSVRQTSAERSQ